MQLRDRNTTARRTVNQGSGTRRALRWLVTFVGFPLGGLLAELMTGPVDAPLAALAGGALTGVTLGSAQAWALRRDGIRPVPWIVATGAGLAVGLGIGAAVVDYGTSAADLAVQGAVCGAFVGAAQAPVLRTRVGGRALLWPPALAAIWALGWTVTTAIGVDVERQYTVFGSSGALVVTLLTMTLPFALARTADRSAADGSAS